MIRHLLAATLALAAAAAHAAWPEKPVKFIVPYPPGGPSDIVLRLALEKMQASLKQPMVLENTAGAGGNLGASEAARATPDGYTWFFATDTLTTVNPHVYKKLGWKVEDLVPVGVASSLVTNSCSMSEGGAARKPMRQLGARILAKPLT